MQYSAKHFYLPVIVLPVLFIQCKIPKEAGNNIPERPFKFGMPYTLKECTTDVKYFAGELAFKAGDVIADVGAGNGYLDGAISVVTDSITFYIEDINRTFLNRTEFDKVIKYYTQVRGKALTNKFFIKIGTRKKTYLPEEAFDKIIITNSFHEFEFPGLMVEDIKRKLKPSGKLIICDAFSSLRKTRFVQGCNSKAYKVSEVVRIMETNGLYPDEMIYPENCFVNYLVFVQDEKSAGSRCRENNALDNLVELLDKKSVAEDSIKTGSVTDSLLLEMNKNNVSNNLYISSWIDGIGHYWLRRKEYKAAMNVFNINLKIFPDYSFVYSSLGEGFMALEQYKPAEINFRKAIDLRPYDDHSRQRWKIASKLSE